MAKTKHGDAAAIERGSRFVVKIPGTNFSCYTVTEENAQIYAQKLGKLPKKSQPRGVEIYSLWTQEPIARREIEVLAIPKYADVPCASCRAPRGERCKKSNGQDTSAHAQRKHDSKDY